MTRQLDVGTYLLIRQVSGVERSTVVTLMKLLVPWNNVTYRSANDSDISLLLRDKKLLIRRWDSERELSLRRHCTGTKNTIDTCINSATDLFLQHKFTKFSKIKQCNQCKQCNRHYAVQGHSRSASFPGTISVKCYLDVSRWPVPNGVETLPKFSIVWIGRTNVTDDRRQTDRQTDGRWHTLITERCIQLCSVQLIKFSNYEVRRQVQREWTVTDTIWQRTTLLIYHTSIQWLLYALTKFGKKNARLS